MPCHAVQTNKEVLAYLWWRRRDSSGRVILADFLAPLALLAFGGMGVCAAVVA